MRYKIIYADAAKQDIIEAFNWYEERQIGLGIRFVNEIKTFIFLIEHNPEMFAVKFENVRSCLMKHFPFKILFTIEKEEIKIWAVYHASRNPTKWKRKD